MGFSKAKKTEIEMLINQVNFNFAKLLKLNRKCSQVKQCKINISEQLFLTFKRKYRLSTRYKPVPVFFKDYNIIDQRFFNEEDFNQIDIKTFKINISKSKSLKILNKNLEEEIVKGAATIGFRFNVNKCKNI